MGVVVGSEIFLAEQQLFMVFAFIVRQSYLQGGPDGKEVRRAGVYCPSQSETGASCILCCRWMDTVTKGKYSSQFAGQNVLARLGQYLSLRDLKFISQNSQRKKPGMVGYICKPEEAETGRSPRFIDQAA